MKGDAVTTASPTIAPAASADYSLCGWRVRSAVALPEVMLWSGEDRSPDVTIRFGAAPPLIDPILHGSGPVQVGQDGVCRLGIRHLANYLVREGREVLVEPLGDIGILEFRSWLLGAVLGMLCHQRGVHPLHAACVRIGDGAAAFAGRTGSGKSTLAAALVGRGHGLVADDVCVVDLAVPDTPRALPSFPRLKLWEDAAQALGIPSHGMPPASFGKRKLHFCQPGGFDSSPAPLRAIYFLTRRTMLEQDEIEPIAGADAAMMLSQEIYRRPIGIHLRRRVALGAETLRIAAAVRLFRLRILSDLPELSAVAARVEAHFATLGKDRRKTR
jgi:hypothetical protein